MMSFNGGGRSRRRAQAEAEAQRSAAKAAPTAPTAEDDRDFGWHASSLDLRLGCQVDERPMDTLPGELLESFFRR